MESSLSYGEKNGLLRCPAKGATYVAYRVQREKARSTGDKVLEAIFHFVGRDEAADAGFYRAMIEWRWQRIAKVP